MKNEIALKLYEWKNPLGINGLISYNHIKQLRITFNLPQNRDLQVLKQCYNETCYEEVMVYMQPFSI